MEFLKIYFLNCILLFIVLLFDFLLLIKKNRKKVKKKEKKKEREKWRKKERKKKEERKEKRERENGRYVNCINLKCLIFLVKIWVYYLYFCII